MSILDITTFQAESTRVCYGTVENIFQIALERRNNAPAEAEKIVWADLVTRSQWFWRFLQRHCYPVLQEISDTLGGPKYAELQPIRLSRPLSFKKEPCVDCQALEKSFVANDQVLRTQTDPFWDQFILCFDHLVDATYAIVATGIQSVNDLARFRNTSDPAELKALKLWDIGTKASEDFQAYGRSCFAKAEICWQQHYDPIYDTSEKVRDLEIDILHKFFTYDAKLKKAIVRLYAIDEKDLCSKCAKDLEPIVVKWRKK